MHLGDGLGGVGKLLIAQLLQTTASSHNMRFYSKEFFRKVRGIRDERRSKTASN